MSQKIFNVVVSGLPEVNDAVSTAATALQNTLEKRKKEGLPYVIESISHSSGYAPNKSAYANIVVVLSQ